MFPQDAAPVHHSLLHSPGATGSECPSEQPQAGDKHRAVGCSLDTLSPSVPSHLGKRLPGALHPNAAGWGSQQCLRDKPGLSGRGLLSYKASASLWDKQITRRGAPG